VFQLYIIYEVEGKERKKKNKQKECFNSILYIELKRKKKGIAECQKMNKQKEYFNSILYMKLKERKKK
jgi:hypothetical protein